MKRIQNVLVFALFLSSCLSFLSCNLILKLSYGLKKPKLEDYESLSKFLEKKKVSFSNVYAPKDQAAFEKVLSWIGNGIPEALFFNRDLKLVQYKDPNNTCNAGIDAFIDSIRNINQHPFQDTLTLGKLGKELVDANTLEAFNAEGRDQDAYILIFWTRYAGKLNNNLRAWQESIQNAEMEGLKINEVFVSLDYQEFWKKEKREEIPD